MNISVKVVRERITMNISKCIHKIKKNKLIDSILRIIMYPFFLFENIKSIQQINNRKKSIETEKYMWIKKLKNICEGERCFIVATGPSLTMEDLDLIKNEKSFSMNASILAFNKTSWRPTYYAIQDNYVYDTIKEQIEKAYKEKKLTNVWISENIEKKFGNDLKYNVFPLYYLDHKMFHRKNNYGKFKFSDDCYSCIYDGYSIIFSILQLACYMGFKKIYLLGCDCNFNLEKSHFVDYGYKDPKSNVMGNKVIQGHIHFDEFAKKNGVEVFNCTRGGMLEVYKRKKLEEVINGEE